MTYSRRRFLGATAVAGTAAVAGCLDNVPIIGGSSLPEFANWLPADPLLDEDNLSVTAMEIPAISEWPEEPTDGMVEEMVEYFGIEMDNIEWTVDVRSTEGHDSLLFGSFDVESIEGELEDELGLEHEEEYEGYQVYESNWETVVVGEDAVLLADDYEEYIDASVGNEATVADDDEDWEAALEAVAGNDMIFLEVSDGTGWGDSDYDEDLVIMSSGISYAGDDFEMLGWFYFEDESDAEDAVDEIEADIDDNDAVIDAEVTVDGRVVQGEATMEEMELGL